MNITKDMLRDLRTDIDAALAAVGTKHGVALKTGSGSFTDTNATFKLDVSVIEGGVVVSKESAFLRKHFQMLGLKEEHLSQVFAYGGKNYTLDGFRNTGGGKPYLVERDDGKKFMMPEEAVKKALGIKEPTY